ncbi:hypothetical protein [Thalassoporum mexicanum]|uniref:hypothetical protein n=1 Tax=Thalassoporum mexicanum TaxID=3457544 RepID=UPI0005A029F9|nr:hypothetical protein [Pseudanabaena sp. PCC 7367]
MHIFFSEGDIRCFLGDRLAKQAFEYLRRHSYLHSKRRIKLDYWLLRDGVARQVFLKVIDHAGHGKKSLLQTANELNVAMPAKTIMDEYKSRMNEAYEQMPEEFVSYAMGDLVLYDLFQARLRQQNHCREVLGINERDKPAMSSGRFVSDLFSEFLAGQCPISDELIEHLSI